jgi:hypothetical protein
METTFIVHRMNTKDPSRSLPAQVTSESAQREGVAAIQRGVNLRGDSCDPLRFFIKLGYELKASLHTLGRESGIQRS